MPTLRPAAALGALLVAATFTLSGCIGLGPDTSNAVRVDDTTDDGTTDGTSDGSTDVPAGFVAISDNSGILSVNVPEAWNQIDGTESSTDSGTLWTLIASSDLDNYFAAGTTVGGVSLFSTQEPSATPQYFLDLIVPSATVNCEGTETDAYDDGVYVGTYYYFSNCGGSTIDNLVIAATDEANTYTIVVSLQMATEEEKTTVRDEVLRTFFATY